MSCKANERHITFEEGCWTFHPNSMYHSVMLSYLQEEHVSCQCTFGSRLHEEREKVNSLCECSEGSFLTDSQTKLNLGTSRAKLTEHMQACFVSKNNLFNNIFECQRKFPCTQNQPPSMFCMDLV